MRIYGTYKDIDNNVISVVFERDTAGSDIEISEESTLQFTGDGVSISENIDSLFDEIITTSASINLLTEDYLGDFFFSKSPKDVTCTITKTYVYDNNESTVTLFDGYVSAGSYNQPYYKPHDRFVVNCTDKLSILQYYYYKNINALSAYNNHLQSAGIVTFKSLLDDVLGEDNWDYDNSKYINFNNLKISESEILGESYNDVWTKEHILEQICRYLSLHVKQSGNRFKLFSWQTIKNSESSYNVYGCDENGLGNIRESDMNITIDDVYNSISVKDNVTPVEDIVSSPLTSDSLYSPYSSSQKYMTEYIVEGKGDHAQGFMKKMLGINTGTIKPSDERYDDCKPHRVDWYMQVKQSENWELYYNGQNVSNSFTGENQHQIMKSLKDNDFMPMLLSIGHSADIPGTDAAPLKKPSLSDYLVISVNGNFDNKDYTSETNSLLNGTGLAKYTGFSAANLAPADPDTTNYVIINGTLKFSPIVIQSGVLPRSFNTISGTRNIDEITYNEASKPGQPSAGYYEDEYSVPTDINGDNHRLLMRRFFEQQRPTQSSGNTVNDNIVMMYPCNDTKEVTKGHPYYKFIQNVGYSESESKEVFDYQYTLEGNDNIDNLPVIACRMTVGDGNEKQWLVETYDNGKSVYGWYHQNELPNGKDWFTIGINPNFNDRIIGQEFKITDNTNEYGIDAEGLAIPVPYGLPLSGRVEFSILGPVNLIWWKDPSSQLFYIAIKKLGINRYINLLSFISAIWISDFSVKIYTDNGYADNKGDSDIYYISDETQNSQDYVAGKYETELNIITQLTTQECTEMDVKNTVNVNSVLGSDNTPINTILDNNTDETCKPEEHYVKEYYEYYKQPKMIVNVTIKDDEALDTNHVYSVSSLPGRTFILMNKDRDLKYNRTQIYLREL